MRLGSIMLLVALIAVVSAQSYYGDLTVSIDERGISTLSGRSNHPLLQPRETSSFTSKKGEYWLFNLTMPANDSFSEYVFEVILPSGASVSYVKTSGQFRITTDGSRVAVKGLGQNSPLSVIVQYQLQMPAVQNENYPVYLIGFLLLLLAFGSSYLLLKKSKKKNATTVFREAPSKEEASAATQPAYNPDLLSDRQKDIVKIIVDAGRPVNQTLICEKLNLPKSSVSRNIDTLVKMGILRKTPAGMSTMIFLNEINKK